MNKTTIKKTSVDGLPCYGILVNGTLQGYVRKRWTGKLRWGCSLPDGDAFSYECLTRAEAVDALLGMGEVCEQCNGRSEKGAWTGARDVDDQFWICAACIDLNREENEALREAP